MMKPNKNGFRRGFLTGLSAPYTGVFGGRFKVSLQANDSVSAAWNQTGRAMRSAIEQERRKIDKTLHTDARCRQN